MSVKIESETETEVLPYGRTLFETLAPWPDWCKGFYPYQEQAIKEILRHFQTKSVVYLDAPTGAGKTLIAEAVRRALGVKGVYICNTRSLQRQFDEAFPDSRLLEGAANYPTLNNKNIMADDCDFEKATNICSYCDPVEACPYKVARAEANASPQAILNTAYWLHAANLAGQFTDRGLVVVDEGDTLPDIICDFAGVNISIKLQRKCKLELPSNVSDLETFNNQLPDWAESMAIRVKAYARTINDKKEKRKVQQVGYQLSVIANNTDSATYIIEGVLSAAKRKKGLLSAWAIKAVHSPPVAYVVTSHVSKLLVMSATLISAEMEAAKLGLQRWEWGKVIVDSPFDPCRRLIVGNKTVPTLSKKVLDVGFPEETKSALEDILIRHEDERVLIHTPSYHLSSTVIDVMKSLPRQDRDIVTYTQASERDEAIAKWLDTENGVFVASSLARGLDLKKDLCRAQIILKLPIPNIGAPQVAARVFSKGGDAWLTLATIRELIQASGRVVRSADDWGITYVLDGKLWEMLSKNGSFFPDWWKKALISDVENSKRIRLINELKEIQNG